MGTLDRYRKKGGFVQLLSLIEASPQKKQLLEKVKDESGVWHLVLIKKMLTLERVLGWSDATLLEIVTRIQPLTLALGLREFGDSWERLSNGLPHIQKRKILDLNDLKNPDKNLSRQAIIKFIQEVRILIKEGVIHPDDPEIHIPDDVEEQILSIQTQLKRT